MKGFELLIRGLAAGFMIAAPVGPVNVLCVSRTLSKGWKSGFVCGLGAAAADTLYGCIAGFSITFVIQFLLREEYWIRLFGGILLVLIGASYFFKRPQVMTTPNPGESARTDFASTFLLNLTNPTTVLSFLAVLAALGMSQRRTPWLTLVLVAGIFCGSMIWWLVLISVVNRLRHQFTDKTMLWMNRIAGLAIGGFGILAFFLSDSRP
jgi:threonine/homoserine/homoserine lactone efflux protein